MKIGIVGVGQWGKRLGAAFFAEGCQIVCHDRKSAGVVDGFGFRCSWEKMAKLGDLDLALVCADAATTQRAATRFAEWGVPCVATKPLFGHPPITEVPFYVDTWRLFSLPWRRMLVATRHPEARAISKVEVTMVGRGPYREYPGTFDYGPHAMAFLYDLGLSLVTGFRAMASRDARGGELLAVMAVGHGRASAQVILTVGNGCDSGVREAKVWLEGSERPHVYSEPLEGPLRYLDPAGNPLYQEKEHAVRVFARHVIRDVRARGEWDDTTLRYSKMSTADLTEARASADLPRYDGDQGLPREN